MIPASVFAAVGLSDRSFKRASDYDLYIRIAAKFEFTIIRKCLTRWRYLPTSVSGHFSLRFFNYLLEDIAILKKHRQGIRRDDRSLIRQILDRKITNGIERLYRYGLETDRVLATRYLLKLLAANPISPTVAVFVAGLWCPDAVKHRLAPAVRRMLFRNSHE
jgi:hypothetical protein